MLDRSPPRGVLGWLVFISVLVALFLALLYAPADAELGDTQRVFYFHVAAAWNGLLAFTVVFASSAAYLVTRSLRWDRLAQASTEVGVVFITIGVLTGSIWARSAWGVWWEWEPRLTSAFVLWLMYVGLLLVRNLVDNPDRRARLAAVFGIAAFADVPIVFMSIRWWRSVHPVVLDAGRMNLAGPMVLAMVAAVAAFSALYVLLVRERLRLTRLDEAMALVRQAWRQEREEIGR